jgi:hypothetical protein
LAESEFEKSSDSDLETDLDLDTVVKQFFKNEKSQIKHSIEEKVLFSLSYRTGSRTYMKAMRGIIRKYFMSNISLRIRIRIRKKFVDPRPNIRISDPQHCSLLCRHTLFSHHVFSIRIYFFAASSLVSPGETESGKACAVVDSLPDSTEDRTRTKSALGRHYKHYKEYNLVRPNYFCLALVAGGVIQGIYRMK